MGWFCYDPSRSPCSNDPKLLSTNQPFLVLTGPTGSGKSRLALELAPRLGAEIISMDSMALYRGMDIGTAKPGAKDRLRVPHHLVDVLDPWESASVAWWLDQAKRCSSEIAARGRLPLFVGGTPLYLKALLHGLFEGPPADHALRQRLEAEAARDGPQALHDHLARVDPSTAARLHVNDLRRIVRALEVWELTRRPISAWQTQWRQHPEVPAPAAGEPDSDVPRCLWLDLPRPLLYRRIDERVEQMIEQGLEEEVRRLRNLDRPLSREAAQALGYKEMFDHLDAKCTREEAIERIKARSRQFAKRQLTWLRHLGGCRPATEQLTFALWESTMKKI